MSIPDYTIVLGVDKDHVEHLLTIFPIWLKNKPSTFIEHPVVIFYDATWDSAVYLQDVYTAVQRHPNVTCIPWPPEYTHYEDDPSNRFGRAQRYKMLAGFVHVPALVVKTPYWLKLDLDVIARGIDPWIDEKWFEGLPAIIASPWSYTKPPDQMLKLDKWTEDFKDKIPVFQGYPKLNLEPQSGSNLVKHSRIISWCGFFETGFTRLCSHLATMSCGSGKLPVPSQDGFMWYVAKRLHYSIKTVRMKELGWMHCSGLNQVKSALRLLNWEAGDLRKELFGEG